jgi:hypothetical protein
LLHIFSEELIRQQKKYDWENEEDDFDVNELEVSYDPEKNKFNL